MAEMDPFSAEGQKKIEEEIRMKNVQENMEHAIEYSPESFARVIMLYVDCQVNGVPLKAFVDSGAQMTIMSKDCATKCGLSHLIDQRWAGMAKGVGTAKIVGRVHLAQMKLGNSFFAVSITILDNPDMEFLFGLDMLKKHQCSIDLKDNALKIAGESIPFLAEKDLPKHMRGLEEEPSSPSITTTTTTTTTTSATPSATLSAVPSASASAASKPGSITSASPSTTASTNSSFDEDKISQLVGLGFSRQQATEALTVSNGDVDRAAAYLLELL